MLPWTTIINVNYFEAEIYTSQAEEMSIPLMYGLLWSDNVLPRYNYLKIWNLRMQKQNLNIEKIAFKVGQIKSLGY